ncbi:hypothetical protein LXL04_038822 [Taraxacum kok-saghyz]
MDNWSLHYTEEQRRKVVETVKPGCRYRDGSIIIERVGPLVIINVNSGNIWVCSGPVFLSVNPSKVNNSTFPEIPTIYYDFYGIGACFCRKRDNRRGYPVLATLKGKEVKV